MERLRNFLESKWWGASRRTAWIWVALLRLLPKPPPSCDTCGSPMREHVPMPPLDAQHFLDREHFYGSRLRASSDGILTTLYTVNHDGKITDPLLLLGSDCEAIRDALDDYLGRTDEFYRRSGRGGLNG